MPEDNRDHFAEEFAEELLDAALANYRSAEPSPGLEERVLANLSRQSRAARSTAWKWTPAMIAVAVMLALFAMDHLMNHAVVSDSASVAVSGGDEARNVGPNPAPQQVKAEAEETVNYRTNRTNGSIVAKPGARSQHQQDLALNSRTPRSSERTDDLLVEAVRITEVRLDEIVISNNDR
jgi:hypothetical protein